jgi:branched-chain amino acid transport system permease protein
MDLQLLLSAVTFGLSIGSIYFLMAIGLSLCFGLMRVISLDQMLYYAIGAYGTYTVHLATGNVWLGVAAGVAAAAIAAVVLERLVFRRIYRRPPTFSMVTSFGILIAGIGAIKYFWGVVPRPVPAPSEQQLAVLGTAVPLYRLQIVAIAALVYVCIQLFLKRTIVGKAIRAGVENVEHVEALGIDVARIFTLVFVIAASLSGLAGGLNAPLVMVEPTMGLDALAFVFTVVIIGGLGSIGGTLVSALVVGQVVSITSMFYAPMAQMAPFAVMLLLLLFRPQGLFGAVADGRLTRT